MAWSFDGQAKAAWDAAVTAGLGVPLVVGNSFPFLVKKIVVVADDTTDVEILHGETTFPGLVQIHPSAADPSASGTCAAFKGTLATQVKVAVGAAGTFDLYLFWFNQASGGIS
jgi:hypothetical protein